MTFIEALKTGRPMRRKWFDSDGPWLYLGGGSVYPNTPCWRRIDTGEIVGLHSYDYIANDWQVMP